MKAKGFNVVPYSHKQKLVLTWWGDNSVYKDKDGIVCDGSIRSGKTTVMSHSFICWAMSRFDGENFALCGKTINSLRRNVIKQLKAILKIQGFKVTEHRSENYLTIALGDVENDFFLFGGKDEASQDLIQGITLAGVFFDEVALMPESFVNQATARCSVEGSKLWFNCNPESPEHYFKKDWIDRLTERNLIRIHFTMDDNPSLSKEIRERYERMYSGVFHDRFVKGLWVLASGLVFRRFAENTNDYLVDDAECKTHQYSKLVMGIDFGGNGSMTTFCLMGYINGYSDFRVLLEDNIPLSEHIGANEICDKFIEFYRRCIAEYGRVDWIFPDSASTTLINSLISRAMSEGLPYNNISGCRKNEISDRPKTFDLLMETGRLKFNSRCKGTINAVANLRWDEKKPDIPEDKNINNINDKWDALCYTILDFIEYIDLYRKA